MKTKILLSFVISILTFAAVAQAKTIDVNNLMHYEILKRNINIGIKFTSDLRVSWVHKAIDITKPGHKILGRNGQPAVCLLELSSRYGKNRHKDYLWKSGGQILFEGGSLGDFIIPGYKTMSLLNPVEGRDDSIRSVKIDNLPYSADEPIDYLYGHADYERYPMAHFMRICDPDFVEFVFVKAKK